MKLTLTRTAQRDLQDIGDWIAADGGATAEAFLDTLLAECRAIIDHPRIYPTVSGGRYPLRRKIFRRYRIFYRALPNELRIISVMHGSRDDRHLTHRHAGR